MTANENPHWRTGSIQLGDLGRISRACIFVANGRHKTFPESFFRERADLGDEKRRQSTGAESRSDLEAFGPFVISYDLKH